VQVLEQNAGKDCTDREVAKFVGVGFGGPVKVEISFGVKYGFFGAAIARPGSRDRTRAQVLRPQQPDR